jgi:hypothetical protein
MEKFVERNDAFLFKHFADRLTKAKAAEMGIANFMYGDSSFVHNSFDDAEEVWFQWKKTKESLSKVFTDDLQTIADIKSKHSLSDLYSFTATGNQPPLLQILKKRLISYETCVIINNMKPCLQNWEEGIRDDPFLSKLILKLHKYKTFVTYDKDRMNLIFNEAKI